MLKETPYWWDTVTFPAAHSGAWPEAVDVAVIGSGITGLAAARELARRGARVAVLEANTLGWGASSRNGGMTLTGLKLGAGTLFARYGRELTRRLFAASVAAIDLVETLVREEGIACDFTRSGHLEVACKPAHFRAFARSAEVMAKEFNHPVRLVARADLPAEIADPSAAGELVVLPGPASQPPPPDDGDEATRIRRAIERAEGDRALAATMLGMSRTTLWRRMRALGLYGQGGEAEG